MNLYPQDLGTRRQIALIGARVAHLTPNARPAMAVEAHPRRRLSPLGRFWTRGSGVEPAAAASALEVMRNPMLGMLGGMIGGSSGFLVPAILMASMGEPVGAAAMGLGGIVMAAIGVTVPKFWFRRLNRKPLSAGEIEALLPSAHNDLERAYVTLAMDAARQEVSPEVEKEVRAALLALGDAIDRLPSAPAGSVDVGLLRREAGTVLLQAQAEPDQVVADSLFRRAQALQRRADAHDRGALLLRRTSALRDELAAQTEALRAGLAAFYGGQADVAGLADLAESVRGVAAEAASVQLAREELETMNVPATKPSLPQANDALAQVLQRKG